MKVCICLPSKGRANQLEAWVGTMLMQTHPADELIVVIAAEVSDTNTHDAVRRLARLWRDAEDTSVYLVMRDDNTTAVQGWNLAYRNMPGCDWYVLGADDIRWHDGWLDEALKVAEVSGALVIGLNDGHTDLNDYAPHYMIHASYIQNEFIPPQYMAWWFDREICQKARHEGVYAPAWLTWCEHRHPDWKTAALDDTYEEALPLRDLDRQTYQQRMKGWPIPA